MENVDKIESFGYKQELKRSLSFWGLLVYGVTFLNPTAPMNLYGIVVGPSGGMIALTFLGLSSLLCKPLFSFFNSIIIDIYQLYPRNRLKVALKY